LNWNRPTTGRPVTSYTVYRKRSDSTSFAILKSGVADTVYKDSTGVQDQTYEYMIAAVDTNNTEGVKSAGKIKSITSAFPLIDSISLKTSAKGAHCFVIGNDSLIYVTFRDDAFIGVFSPQGDSVRAFGKGMFSQLGGIVMDSKERLYVIDPDYNKCVKFSINGDTLLQWSVSYPAALAIDSQDNIYISYANGGRLARFDTSGALQDSLILPTGSNIGHLAISNDGSLFTGDGWSQNIMKYGPTLSNSQNVVFQKSENTEYFYRLQEIDRNNNLFFEVEYSINHIGHKQVWVYNVSGSFIAKTDPFLYFNALRIIGNRIIAIEWTNKVKIFRYPF
jgi:hypothetical protein